jgi:biopolymer transport protein TolR
MAERVHRASGSVGFGDSPLPTVTGMEGRSVTSSINVTPMVDVMLVLLIIFMVITPILAAYEAELPQAQYVVPEPDDDVVTLGIDAYGVYHLGDRAIPPEQLAAELRHIYTARPDDHLLYLRADRRVGYDVVLSAIDAARAAGVRTIGAITDPKQEEETRTAHAAPATWAERAATNPERR